MSGRNLFIPLKREYYEAFQSGEKKHELRLYGPRWNERTCIVGRRATLSLGYGKRHRTDGTVTSFEVVNCHDLPTDALARVLLLFGTTVRPIAKIGIAVDVPGRKE